jgi:hypothetical protein
VIARGLRLAATVALASALTLLPAAGFALASAHLRRVALGVYVDSAEHPGRLKRFSELVGREPVIVSSYRQWPQRPFPRRELTAVWNRGAVPMVTWEPWTYTGRPFPLRRIAAGDYDGYVRSAARAAAAWGHPILLRFAHEMNGTWYPWSRGRGGNTPRVYKAAWRHVVRIFRAEGAGNVSWVWAPNVNNGGRFPFARFYPGDRWVDWVGLDGFNWGKNGEWDSFTEIFATSYNALAHLTSRPIIITETASNQHGGDKAAWVTSALRREIPRFSRIRAVVWFSEGFNGVDARVNSSSASLRAFRAAIASPRYGLTRQGLLSTPHRLRRAAAPPAPGGGFGEPSLFHRLLQKLHGRNLLYAIGLLVAFLLLLAVLAAIAKRKMRRRAARRTAAQRPRAC